MENTKKTNIVLLIVVIFITRAITYAIIDSASNSEDRKSNDTTNQFPRTSIEKEVEDTGVYLPDDESPDLSGSDAEDWAESYGKHYVFIGKLGSAEKVDGQYRYGPVEDFNHPSDYFFVVSDTELSHADTQRYAQIDGIVCGKYYGSESVASSMLGYPILKVHKIRKIDLQETVSPVLHQVEPKLKAKQGGLKVSVDSIVYRDKLTSLSLTLTNLTNDHIQPWSLTVHCDGEEIGYDLYDGYTLQRYYWDDSGDLPDSQIGLGTPLVCDLAGGESITATYALKPADFNKDLEIELKFSISEGELKLVRSEDGDGWVSNEYDHRTVKMTYSPQDNKS